MPVGGCIMRASRVVGVPSLRGRCERKEREMARKQRRSIGDTAALLVILAALVWAFAPGVGWDLLGLRSRLGWPPLRSGQALSSLPDSEAARQLRELTVRESGYRTFRVAGVSPRCCGRGWCGGVR